MPSHTQPLELLVPEKSPVFRGSVILIQYLFLTLQMTTALPVGAPRDQEAPAAWKHQVRHVVRMNITLVVFFRLRVVEIMS